MECPGQSAGPDSGTHGGGAQGAAAPSGGGGGAMASADASPGGAAYEGRGRGWRPPPPPGLEAARERRRLRRADAMSMVSDIMTMLSRVPWTAHVEEAARRTRRELSELRNLMIAEKALLEERRFMAGPKVGVFSGGCAATRPSFCLFRHLATDTHPSPPSIQTIGIFSRAKWILLPPKAGGRNGTKPALRSTVTLSRTPECRRCPGSNLPPPRSPSHII